MNVLPSPPHSVASSDAYAFAGPYRHQYQYQHQPETKTLVASSFRVLEQAPPPTLREILTAYKTKGDGDRDMLLAMLNAKSAEDQRLAATASLHKAVLDAHSATLAAEHPPSRLYSPYPSPAPLLHDPSPRSESRRLPHASASSSSSTSPAHHHHHLHVAGPDRRRLSSAATAATHPYAAPAAPAARKRTRRSPSPASSSRHGAAPPASLFDGYTRAPLSAARHEDSPFPLSSDRSGSASPPRRSDVGYVLHHESAPRHRGAKEELA